MREKINNKKSRTAVIVITLILSLFAFTSVDYCEASTLYVGGGGAYNYTSIQEAVNAADEGDTIFIYSDVYAETVFITKNINLVGEDKNNTIIMGPGTGDVIHVENCSVEIQNILVKDSGNNEGDSGIELKNTHDCKISNVEIKDSYYGLYILFSNNITVEKSTLSTNYFGIYTYISSHVIASQNTITSNYRQGIYVQASNHNEIIINKISNNIEDGVYLRASHYNHIEGNNISSSESSGVYLKISNNNTVRSNVITGCEIGLKIDGGVNSTMNLNNFIFNFIFNAYDNAANKWDEGNQGNYWDDYEGIDINEDGIGDTHYELPGGSNVDNFPLMNPTIVDIIPPKFNDIDTYPLSQELNGLTNISCIVTDNLKVESVLLNITYPNNISYIVNMTNLGGDKYYSVINCALYGDYKHIITATDIFNNTNVSSLFQFSVIYQQKPPEITCINASPNPQEFPQPINISSAINDNVATEKATVVLKKDEDVVGNYTLQGINTDENGNGLYAYEFIPPHHANYTYYIWTKDINFNQNSSAVYTFSTKDTTPPEINNISIFPSLQDVNEPVNISCSIIDNHEIGIAGVNIFCPNGSIINNTMNENNEIYSLNRSFSLNGTYNYSIWAKDKNNNYNLSASYSFKITYFPIANFSYTPPNPTDLDTVTFNASSSYDQDGYIVNYTWAFGDGKKAYGVIVTHNYDDNDEYNISLTVRDNDGAWKSLKKEIYIANIPPVANFSHSPMGSYVVVGQLINFTDLSYDLDGFIWEWRWDFGDGNVHVDHTGTPPTHTYSINGVFNVSLTVKDNDFSSGSSSKSIIVKDVNPPSIKNLTALPNPQEIFGIVNITCHIIDDVNVNYVEVNITEPNGNFSTAWMKNLQNSSVYYYASNYSLEGNYSYFVWANDTSSNANFSLIETFTIVIPAEPPEIKNVSAMPVQQEYGSAVNISAYITENVEVANVKVLIKDPEGITLGNFSMQPSSIDEYGNGWYFYNSTYFSLGNYSYVIWAVDINAYLNHSEEKFFRVVDTTPPEIKNVSFPMFKEPDEAVNISCVITDNMEVLWANVTVGFPNGTVIKYVMNSLPPLYWYNSTFTLLGEHNYTIQTLDGIGNSGYYNGTFVITFFPFANFSHNPSNPTDLDDINFFDLSTDLDGSIVNWLWDFGDGNVSYEQNPTHQYNDDGLYQVNLTVTDNDGATDAISKQIVVSNVPPIADFMYSPSNPSPQDTIQFNDLSYDLDGAIINWLWDFGDGNVSYEQNPTHQYNDEGVYQVNLTVTDNDGVFANVIRNIILVDTQSPSVMVSAPNGGEQWQAGSPHYIYWSATDNVGVTSIDIYYSTNGGSTYPYVIVTGTSNDGIHLWNVPSTPSATCRVKVVAHDASGNTGQDTSNGNFEISMEWDPWSYDTMNPYGIISKPEVIKAIQDYFAYLIEKWQVIQVIQLYFS